MESIKLHKQERISASDSSKIKTTRSLKRSFGKANDYIEVHIHDLGGKLLKSVPHYRGYSIPDQIAKSDTPSLTNTIFIDPTKILGLLEFHTGQFNLVCNIQRKKIYDGRQTDFYIKEISPSRRELKIGSHQYKESNLKKATLNYISDLEESLFNKDFILNFGDNICVLGVNIAWNNDGGDILIKLYEPLPQYIEEKRDFG